MFHTAEAFNGDVSKWDMRTVQNANKMFRHATLFNHTWCDDAWLSLTSDADFVGTSAKVICCPTGKYYNVTEVSSCGFCAPGKYNGVLQVDKQLPLSCVDCPRNTFAPFKGLTGCSNCEPDQYRYNFFLNGFVYF